MQYACIKCTYWHAFGLIYSKEARQVFFSIVYGILNKWKKYGRIVKRIEYVVNKIAIVTESSASHQILHPVSECNYTCNDKC